MARHLSVWKHWHWEGGADFSSAGFSMPEYRRRLPHFQPDDAYLFLTWRLWGSLPAKAEAVAHPTPGHAFATADRELGRRISGPLWLTDTRVAELVSRTILAGDSERRYYDLCAWAVMPNHVHLLVLPRVPVSRLMKWLKGSTARGENLILGRTGNRFWQDESYDHYLRNSRQLNRTVAYVEENPVAAGLVADARSWPWSSAGWQTKVRPTKA